MENNKQQTAIDWFGMEMGKLFAQYHGKIICIGEFHQKRFELEEKSKEMEKKQIVDGIVESMTKKFRVYTESGLEHFIEIAEQHYNETYGGGNK
jgi:hypothetical protein